MEPAILQTNKITFITDNSRTIREILMEYSSMLMERHTWGNTCREIDTVMEFSNGRVAQRAKDNGN